MHWIVELFKRKSRFAVLLSSLISRIRNMASRADADKAISSDSVDDSDTSVCKRLDHTIGTPASMMMNPVREHAVFGSYIACVALALIHSPANEASTYTSRLRVGCGEICNPLSFVPSRYLPMRFTAFPWMSFGLDINREH